MANFTRTSHQMGERHYDTCVPEHNPDGGRAFAAHVRVASKEGIIPRMSPRRGDIRDSRVISTGRSGGGGNRTIRSRPRPEKTLKNSTGVPNPEGRLSASFGTVCPFEGQTQEAAPSVGDDVRDERRQRRPRHGAVGSLRRRLIGPAVATAVRAPLRMCLSVSPTVRQCGSGSVTRPPFLRQRRPRVHQHAAHYPCDAGSRGPR